MVVSRGVQEKKKDQQVATVVRDRTMKLEEDHSDYWEQLLKRNRHILFLTFVKLSYCFVDVQLLLTEEKFTITESERLLIIIEQIGRLLGSILNVSDNQSTIRSTLYGTRQNIGLEALIFNHDNLTMTSHYILPTLNLSSPGYFRPSFEIPSIVILNQSNPEGTVISSVSRNIHLPTERGERVESLILSIQISTNVQNRIMLTEPVSLFINIGMPGSKPRFNPRCEFFDLSSTIGQRGRFSTDGIIQSDTTNNTFVQCSTTHLTSFAVLVDVSGGRESTALSIVSYIGCAISIICLLIAVILLVSLRRRVFNLQQHFVHLNLSIALLLGLITFVSGIETASEYRASCLIVAILLHYFFMAAFSWMLCEGILVFIMIKLVFYNGFLKRKLFFVILGWGLPLPIVIISAAVSHEHYGINDRCWISEEEGAVWAFVGPILLIILVNMVFLTITIYEVFKGQQHSMTADKIAKLRIVKSLLKAAVIFVPLLGSTWVFGILAINEDTVVFAWLFTVLNSLQGLFILLFDVVKTEKFLTLLKTKWNVISLGTQTSHIATKDLTVSNPRKESTTSGIVQDQDISHCDLICHVECTDHADLNEAAVVKHKHPIRHVESAAPVDRKECVDQLDIQQVVQTDLSKYCTTAVDSVLVNPASFIPPMQVQSLISSNTVSVLVDCKTETIIYTQDKSSTEFHSVSTSQCDQGETTKESNL
ncbi:adhesion G protein-coupled receptor L3-like [Dysidea avara]|uniref:adhesion G protein-coupled receptor L3-like n=1 Tax=Dysidea avara TaxID=196820 RepID=UPI003321F8C2